MKKILITILYLGLFASISNAQVIENSKDNRDRVRDRNEKEINRVYPSDRYNSNRHYNNKYNWNKNDTAKINDIKKKIDIMIGDIKKSEKYGDRKKEALIKELNFSIKKMNDADENKDGILNYLELQAYQDSEFIITN